MKTELLKKALDAGLYEYGFECRPLTQKWADFLSGERRAKRLVVAYNNSDNTFASLPVFTAEKDVFLKGMDVLCRAFEVESVAIYLPECASEEVQQTVSAYNLPNLQVVADKVNVRELGEEDLIHHPETVVNIGRVEDGEKPLVYVCVKEGDKAERVVLPLESTVDQFIQAAGFTVRDSTSVVVGGFGGKVLRGDNLNQPIYGYGSSLIQVFPGAFCPVSYAQKASAYASDNSCGRCTFCREGNYQIARFLQNAVTGHGSEEDMAWLDTISEAVADESVCSFGQESVRFLRETLGSDRKAYEAHIRGKRCDTGVCQAFTDYAIDGSLCVGCDRCRQVCAFGAIEDGPGYIHRIDAFDCTKCGKCAEVCPEKAIYKVRVGRQIGPTKATKVGRFRTSRKRY